VGSHPPIGATYSAACFGPVATGREKRRELERRRRKQVLGDSEQPVVLNRRVRLEQDTSELLEDYALFIGISAEEVLNIVLKKMIANDMEFQSWLSQQNGHQQHSQTPLGVSGCVVETEAA
jgi:hypothetical protein